MSQAIPDDLKVEMRGATAVITIDRPKALNALTTAMRARMAEAFPRFARDPMLYAVIIRSASPKAFSAGGDVREITHWGRTDIELARKSFRDEYALNWALECFSKPTISLIDGMVMGSGVGISSFGTHRVAGEGYRFAMPETQIGLFPDVGACHVLARLPDEIGMYLALTGRSIGRADAFALGLATHCIPVAAFEDIAGEIADVQPVDPVLDSRHQDPGPGEIEPYRATIARCFAAETVEAILWRLGTVEGATREWAEAVAAELRKRAPLSLKVTHRHVREARARDLRQTLQIDYRLACRFLAGHDFYEGVRAQLVDKDGAPRWRPDRIEDVTEAMIEDYFAPMGAAELVLPTRQEMQQARS